MERRQADADGNAWAGPGSARRQPPRSESLPAHSSCMRLHRMLYVMTH